MAFFNISNKTLGRVAVVATMLAMATGAMAQNNTVENVDAGNKLIAACKFTSDIDNKANVALSLNSVAKVMIAAHGDRGLHTEGPQDIQKVCGAIKSMASTRSSTAWKHTEEVVWHHVAMMTRMNKDSPDQNDAALTTAQLLSNFLGIDNPAHVYAYTKQMALNASPTQDAGDPTGDVVNVGKTQSDEYMDAVLSSNLPNYGGPQ